MPDFSKFMCFLSAFIIPNFSSPFLHQGFRPLQFDLILGQHLLGVGQLARQYRFFGFRTLQDRFFDLHPSY